MSVDRLDEATRRERVAGRLRAMIVSGEMPAGARMGEADLSARLGVSRAPLREAFRELVAEGLLVSEPYRGLFVRRFSRADLVELYSLRTALEQFAVREAWPRRDAAARADLAQRHEALTGAIASGADPRILIARELALHSWVYELSGHRLLQQHWARMRPNIELYFALHQRAHRRAGPAPDAHAAYVAFAGGEDLAAMLEHVEGHMRQGLDRTLGFIDDADRGPTAKGTATRNDPQPGRPT